MERMALRARRSAGLYTAGVDEGLRGVLADEEQPRSQDDSVAQGCLPLSQISTALQLQRVSPSLGVWSVLYFFKKINLYLNKKKLRGKKKTSASANVVMQHYITDTPI